MRCCLDKDGECIGRERKSTHRARRGHRHDGMACLSVNDIDRPVFGRAWRWKDVGCLLPRIERGGARESPRAGCKQRCGLHSGNSSLRTARADASHAPTGEVPETRMTVLVLQAVPDVGEGKQALIACHPGYSLATALRRLRERAEPCKMAAERRSPHGGPYAVATRGGRAEAESPPPAEGKAEAGKARGEPRHEGALPPGLQIADDDRLSARTLGRRNTRDPGDEPSVLGTRLDPCWRASETTRGVGPRRRRENERPNEGCENGATSEHALRNNFILGQERSGTPIRRKSPGRAPMRVYSVSVARLKAGTEQMRTFNDIAGKHAEEVLLDDGGLGIFDAFEPVRDVESVADLRRARRD